MNFDIRTIGEKLVGLHCQKDLESLTKDELIELVNELVSELDNYKND